mmetsp:Transcript_16250/g.23685  ORF Transcript_16250/g.23685 Transcript_16250/m.23685 type:complete len:241 (-) Transcript_16250:277-999(-)
MGEKQLVAEGLHLQRVAKLQLQQAKSASPGLEVLLLCVSPGGVCRPARCGQHRGACPQQLQTHLVADAHPAAGHQAHAPGQVRGLQPLEQVPIAAAAAQLVVEPVRGRVRLLAHVTVASEGTQRRKRLRAGRWGREKAHGDGGLAAQAPHGTAQQSPLLRALPHHIRAGVAQSLFRIGLARNAESGQRPLQLHQRPQRTRSQGAILAVTDIAEPAILQTTCAVRHDVHHSGSASTTASAR